MNIIWQELAKLDLEDAANFYDDIDEHLGRRFVAAVEVAIAEIKTWPNLRRKFDGKARKTRVKNFPYALLYWVDGDIMHIIAVMHLHREPGYWHNRVH